MQMRQIVKLSKNFNWDKGLLIADNCHLQKLFIKKDCNYGIKFVHSYTSCLIKLCSLKINQTGISARNQSTDETPSIF